MAQLLVRNLDDMTINLLKRRAKRHHRSVTSEVKTILTDALSNETDWREQVEQVRAIFEGRSFSDSTDLVREDRDR